MLSRFLSSRISWVLGFGFLIILVIGYSARGRAASYIDSSFLGSSYIDSSHIDSPVRSGSLLDTIRNETLGFEKIFVINLKSRTDHRDAMALAASLTGMKLNFVEAATDVEKKALPPGGSEMTNQKAVFAVWRSHLNVLRTIVEQNISSALIMEDDVDWSIRIKDQLQQFALASQLLVQPVSDAANSFLDPTYDGEVKGQQGQDFIMGQHTVHPPTTSAYGDIDRWDLLWIGHCGSRMPDYTDGTRTPLGRVIIPDDETVPEPQHFRKEYGGTEVMDNYPPHTRAVFRTGGNVCTLGYAVSLQGARKILYELGIHKMDAEVDGELDAFCRGRNGRPLAICLTVQPQYIQHHRPVGKWSELSDITEFSDDANDIPFTTNIRQSVRVNFAKLVAGETDLLDRYKDGEPHAGPG